MTKDIGIVFLPNSECRNIALKVSEATNKALSGFKQLQNNPHITAIHIANLNEEAQANLKQIANNFFPQHKDSYIELPVAGIKATGGNMNEGFKWLDLQFKTLEPLKELRTKILEEFCPLHNGIVTRMNDDPNNFIEGSLTKQDIDKCGVTFSSYIPHITAWYIDLPNDPKTTILNDVAQNLSIDIGTCYAENIALVELGRNGNAMEIIATYPLGTVRITPEYTEEL